MLLFYEGSTGLAALYEVANHGGLGSKVYQTSNWKNTWTDIEYYSTARHAKRNVFPLNRN
jgi:hypothetical protein